MFRNCNRIAILATSLLLTVCMATGCFSKNGALVENEAKSAYEIAVENGFQGSVEDWLATLKGTDGDVGAQGVGIAKVEYINGDLIITYTDGRQENLGTLTNEKENTDFEFYRLSDGTYGVLSCNLTDRSVIEIPVVHYGRAVTEIFDHAFQNDTEIERVVIPATVKSIGNEAFAGCTALTSINIPSSVAQIDAGAFSGCTSLEQVTFEDSEEWRANGILLDHAVLSNASEAAALLTGAYANTAWRCLTSDSAQSVTEVVDRVADAVVVINAQIVTNSFFGSTQLSTSAGSGVIVSETGYILTCNHVVDGARSIEVKLHSGTSYTAELVGSDVASDIAVLRITPNEVLTAVNLGSSAALVVGEPVVAIGNPLGTLDGTVTSGIISATERTITMSDGTSMTLLQTDAAINSGNSGGGLFNIHGELIGIVNAKYAQSGVEGLAFAIPIDWANEVKQDLIEYGYVRGILDSGLETLDVTSANLSDYNYRFGITEIGVYVVSSKYTTELKNKDRIIAINGVAVNTTAALEAELGKYQIGDTVTVKASREKSEFTASLTLREYIPDGIA